MLSTGFGSEFASMCSDVCTRWLLNTCLPTANPFLAPLAVATCDRLTVVISISHVWNLLRREDVHLHTPALRIGTHFLLTLKTVVFLFHLKHHLKTFLFSFYYRLAHAARLGFFYKNALYKLLLWWDSDLKSLSVKTVWGTKDAEWISWQWLESWKHRQSA